MLKIFDKDHNAIGHVVKYKDCKIESEVATGDKTLSFTYLAKHHALENEMYVRTRDDEYVIKEVPATTDGFPQIVAILNLEDLQRDMWQTFSVTDTTIDAAVRTVLAGTGWTIGYCDVTKKRNAGMIQVSTLGVIQNLCTAFMCEPVFDTINKTVSFYNKRGEDKGVYFLHGLNLKKLQKKSTSYDYYTRIIPIGQNGLGIADVNDGKNYLENYQYSNKVLTYIWKDESYTDAQALMEDAELKLEDLSKPEKSFSADVRDLAKQKPEYSILAYGLGDTVTIIDPDTGIREKQRIKKITEYPQNPNKNTCEIANTVLNFEELQQKYQAAADIINYTVAGDGRYTGTINVSDILNFESGLAGSSTVGGLNNSITDMQGEVAGLKLTLGELETNYLRADEADLKYATIERLTVVDEYVHDLEGDYASFKSVTADEFAAHTALIDTVVGDLADYKTVVSEELVTAKGWMLEGAIGDAQISSVAANKLTAGTIDTAIVTIAGTDGRLQISDNTIQISDDSTVRVQIGKDASGDYSMSVWDASGNLIWDALGATEHTIQRQIIRDSMVANDAAIQALKIDFQSFDTALTEQGVVISGTVVQVGSKTLNVVLSEQEQINTEYGETLSTHSSKIAANEQEILLKVSTQVYESDMAAMESSLQTVETSVGIMDGQITALVKDNTIIQDKYNDLESRTATLELSADNFAVELASTQKTVSDNYVTLQDYTDAAKASAISTAAADATAKADNALTAAKADATTKANQALSDAMDALDITNATVAVHAETISDHETRIAANEDAISLKVSTKDFSSYQTTVTGQISTAKSEAISTAASDATSKANKALSDAKTDATAKADAAKASAVSTAATDATTKANNAKNAAITAAAADATTKANAAQSAAISTAASDATAKANQALIDANEYTTAEITTVNESLSITNQEISVMKGQIALKVEQKDVDTAVTNLQIGGRNLALNTKKHYTIVGQNITNQCANIYRLSVDWVNMVDRPITVSFDYEYSEDATCTNQSVTYLISVGQNASPWTRPFHIPKPSYGLKGHVSGTFSFHNITLSQKVIGYRTDYFSGSCTISNLKFELGNKATDWTPAPEDVDSSISAVNAKFASYSTTSEMESAITVAKSEITSEVSEKYSTKAELETVDGKVTTLEEWKVGASQKITKDGIIATVGNYYAYQTDLDTVENRVTEAESKIIQHADEIDLRVEKDGIINAINLSTEEVKISAARITLAGATIADSFTATNLHVTGNSVFDGTLRATKGTIGGWNIGSNSIDNTNSSGNYVILSNGTNANQDVLIIRTGDGTTASPYDWPVYICANGQVGFSNANITGAITATSITAKNSYSIHDSNGNKARALYSADGSIGNTLLVGDGFSSLHLGGLLVNRNAGQVLCGEDGSWNLQAGKIHCAALYTYTSSINVADSATSGNPGVRIGPNDDAKKVFLYNNGITGNLWLQSVYNGTTKWWSITNHLGQNASDIRLKSDIKPTKINGLEKINQMTVKSFYRTDEDKYYQAGFVADDLEKIDCNLVLGGGYTDDGHPYYKSINPLYLTTYAIKGIQELYSVQVEHTDRILTVEVRQDNQQLLIEQLMDENAKLKKRVAQLEEQQAA